MGLSHWFPRISPSRLFCGAVFNSLNECSLVYFLVLFSVISSATDAVSTTDSSGPTSASSSTTPGGVIEEEASSSLNPAIIVVSVTFPAGILVAIAWCYCMTAVLKIRTHDKAKKPRLSEIAEHNQRHYHESRDQHHHQHHRHHEEHHRERSPSPLSSSASSSPCESRSQSPLPPDIP